MDQSDLAPSSKPALTPGDAYGGGFFIGITQEDGKLYRNIVAPKRFELVGAIGCQGEDVKGANSYTDGRANTEAYAAAGSALAAKVIDLQIDGLTDWSIPARDVLELMYRHLKPTEQENYCSFRDGDNPSSVPPGYPYTEDFPAQTGVELFRASGEEAFETDRWYVASMQYSAYYAWLMDFSDGTQYCNVKCDERRVRPVRRERIQ